MKLFSTSSREIPKILTKNINMLKKKTKLLLLIEILPNIFVKIEFLFWSMFISTLDIKLIKVGRRVKVTIKETIKPRVIIHPKSIIGLISLNIKEINAQIVVNTV